MHYDLLTRNVDYDGIALLYDSILWDYKKTGCTLLDLGCGTGSLSERMSKKGFDVIGLDISNEMLSVAFEKKCESGSNIQYVCQDMTELELYGEVGAVVSALDCLNHLGGEKELKKTFQRVAKYMEAGGIFLFDLNTILKHRDILSDNCFVYEEEKVMCVWQNSYNGEDNSVDIYLDFFEEDEDGRYTRYCEEFSEIAYPIESVKNWLSEAGFEVLSVYDGFTKEQGSEDSERVVFVARKI